MMEIASKEKIEVSRIFPRPGWALPVSHSHIAVTQPLWVTTWKKKKRWHFLTFKKCSLIITNCTISHILLLIRLAIKKKWKLKLSVLCSLWNTTSNVLVSVPWLPSREGEALVCSWHSAPTADRRTENIWHQIRHKVYIYYRSRFIDLWARFKN